MAGIDFSVPPPALFQASSGKWQLVWDRSKELELASTFLGSMEERPLALLVRNAGRTDIDLVAAHIGTATQRRALIIQFSGVGPFEIWIAIAGLLAKNEKLFLTNTASEIVKYTSGASMHLAANSTPLRSVSNYIHAQRRAGAPVTLREAIRRFGLRPSADTPALDVPFDGDTSAKKQPPSSYPSLVGQDIANSRFLNEYFQQRLLVLLGRRAFFTPSQFILPNSQVPIRLILEDQSRSFAPSGASHYTEDVSQSGVSVLTFSTLEEPEALDLLGSLSKKLGLIEPEATAQAVTSVSARRTPRRPGRAYLGRGELEAAVAALDNAQASQFQSVNIDPRAAPLDAYVEEGRLRLAGRESPKSGTPLEQLDHLRSDYVTDLERLRNALSGTNAASGFLARLEKTSTYLQEPLTEASSLALAVQVTALERYIPALEEVLTTPSLADAAVTVASLGLFVRQFGTWRAFIAEAEQSLELDRETRAALDTVTNSLLSNDTEALEADLRKTLDEVSEASKDGDQRLQFGLLRAVGNIYRAAGRYLRESATSVGRHFRERLENSLGEGLADSAVAGILAVGTVPLTQLATSSPNEFGWLMPILVYLAARNRGQ